VYVDIIGPFLTVVLSEALRGWGVGGVSTSLLSPYPQGEASSTENF